MLTGENIMNIDIIKSIEEIQALANELKILRTTLLANKDYFQLTIHNS